MFTILCHLHDIVICVADKLTLHVYRIFESKLLNALWKLHPPKIEWQEFRDLQARHLRQANHNTVYVKQHKRTSSSGWERERL
jgi:hypothetical protein